MTGLDSKTSIRSYPNWVIAQKVDKGLINSVLEMDVNLNEKNGYGSILLLFDGIEKTLKWKIVNKKTFCRRTLYFSC